MNTSRYLRLAVATLCLQLLNRANGLQVRSCQLGVTRLSHRVLPKHYNLNVRTFHSNMNVFEGNVKIDISLNNELKHSESMLAQQIMLHADADLSIDDLRFDETNEGEEDTRIPVLEICRDPENGLMRLDLAQNPKSGQGRLNFKFTGPVHQEAKAVFNASSTMRKLITTRFGPAMARKAFPCFDEPDLKATFDVSIELPNELTALSNMEPAKTENLEGELDGFKRVVFRRTPEMSTHSLAFAVGEFNFIEDQSRDMKIAFWTPPGKSQSAKQALKIAVDGYAAMLDYFQIALPLKKIDVIAVENFDGAAAYWGMNMIEETVLLADERHLTADDSHWLSTSILYNLAKHWFGNLVTVKCWDDLWLEAGLAEWMSRFALSIIRPDYDSRMFYLLKTMMKGLNRDSLKSGSHPIKNSQVQTAKEIEASSNTLIYQKADCVIGMLENYIGPANFKQGLREYISENLYGSADAENLGFTLRKMSGMEVHDLMRSWTSQAGHPLVEVSLSEGKLNMIQHKFPSPDRDSSLENKEDSLWTIPITILVSGNEHSEPETLQCVLSGREYSTDLPSWFDPTKHWLKLNAHFEGFYRVQYDPHLYQTLREPVESKEMPPADRLNLIDEAQALFRSGLMTRQQLRETISWFITEDNDGVFLGLVVAIRVLSNVDKNDRTGLSILLRYYEQNGRAQPNPLDGYLKVKARDEVLRYLVLRARVHLVIKDCYELYKSLKETHQTVPSSFREAIYASVSLEGTDEEFEHLITVDISNLPGPPQREAASSAILILLESSKRWKRFVEYQNRLALISYD